MRTLSTIHALQNLNAVFRCNLFKTAPIKSVCRVVFLKSRRFFRPCLLNAFAKTALAALMTLGVCSGTVKAGGPCNGAAVNYNIPFVMHLCVNPGGCDDPRCFRDFDTMTWDNIEVRLRSGWVPGPYDVNATENACAFTHSIRVNIMPDGSHTVVPPYIGGLAVNVVDWTWSANIFPPVGGVYATAEADGTRNAGTVCGGAGADLHGTVVLTVGPPPLPDENQTKQCDLSTSGCSGSGCSGGPMAKYSIHLMLASLHIEDTPISYNSPRGPSTHFKVVYNQREANQPANFDYSNFGPKWTFNWLSYVTDDGSGMPSPNPTVYVRGGGTEVFGGFDSRTNSYAPDKQTLAVLVWRKDGTYEKRFPDGSKEIFTRSDSGKPRRVFLTGVVDAAGNFTTLDYDEILRITSITDSLGQPTTFQYTERWKIETVTDPFGRSAHFEYKGDNGQLSKITDPIGIESQFEYEPGTDFIKTMTTPYGTTTFARGGIADEVRWVEATDPMGGKERVEYHDSALNVASSESSAPPNVYNNDLEFQNTFYWDKTAMSEAPGDYSKAQVFHWLKTANGKVSGIKNSEKKALESRVWYTYETQTDPTQVGKNALPIKVARLVGLGATQLHQYSYNAMGNLLKETDPVGRVKIYGYDTNDIDVLGIYQRNLTTGASLDPVDHLAADKIAVYTYNSLHERLTEAGADGQVTTYHYNSDGQLLTSTNAKGETTTYTYDRDQNSDGETDGYLVSIASPAFNNVSAVTNFTYDEAKRVKEVIKEPDHFKVTTSYDDIDRKTVVTYPDGTYEAFQYTDNVTGGMTLDLTGSRDRLGRWTYRHYNGNRQMDSITDPLGRTTQYWWCTCGSLMGFNDPNGNSTAFNRDLQNRIYQKYTEASTITYVYEDLTSRLASSTLGFLTGRRTNYSYDVDNNINSITYDDTSGSSYPPTPSVSYTYDNHNRVKTVTVGGTDVTIYDYNTIPAAPTLGAGKLHTIDGPLNDDTITFGYDELGRVTTQGIQGGEDSVVHFDSLGRVDWTENALGHFDRTYDGVTPRLIQTVAQAIGQTTKYTYFGNNQDRRLQTLENLATGGANLSKFDYTYDVDGQIRTWNRQLGTTTSGRWFDYDAARQLLSSRNASTQSSATEVNGYTYDNAENRTGDSRFNPQGPPGNGTFHTYAPNGLNQIDNFVTEVNGVVSSPVDLTYDYPGNLIGDGQGKTYEWDAASRLVAVNDTATSRRSEFTYDGLSRRVKILEKAGSTVTSTKLFVWVGNMIAQERDLQNQVTRRYFAEGEYREKPYYYTRDHLGSIRELTNSDGVLVARYDYDPYGNRTKFISLGATLDVDFGYTGHYHHAPSGLILTLYRAYNPGIGRWISKDPIGETAGINLYEYVNNDPTRWIDPLGLYVPPPPPLINPVVAAGAIGLYAGTLIYNAAPDFWAQNLWGWLYDQNPQPAPTRVPRNQEDLIHCKKISDECIEGERHCVFECEDGTFLHGEGAECDLPDAWKVRP